MTKVLLVEDDNNLREIYEARLLSEGYEVIAGKDGEDALSLIKQYQPDLVISDVMMPRISGFEMLDILRNTGGITQPKVIMLTALGQAEDRAHADGIGADLYLVKSQVTLEDIVKAAQDLTSAPAAEAAAAPAPEPQPVPEPQNIEIPEPSFSPASPVATEEPAPVIPEPTTEVPAAITNAEPAPQPAAPTTEAPVAQQPESSPSAAQPAADLPQTNVDTENEAIITDAAETLQAATPNAVSADATEDVPVAPSTSSKVIEPLSQNEGEKHINDLLAEEEAAAAIITPPEPEPQVQSQPQTYQAPTEPATPLAPPLNAAPEQPVAQPQAIGQPTAVAPPVAAPATNPETPFAPSVGGSANTDAL